VNKKSGVATQNELTPFSYESERLYQQALYAKGNCSLALYDMFDLNLFSTTSSLPATEASSAMPRNSQGYNSQLVVDQAVNFQIEEDDIPVEARIACINKAYSEVNRVILFEQKQCEPADIYLFCMNTEELCNPTM
jgi:hypothetical protein